MIEKKSYEELAAEGKPFYIILKSDEYIRFDKWCQDNKVELVKSEHTYFMLIKGYKAYPIIGCIRHMMLRSLTGYRFSEMV